MARERALGDISKAERKTGRKKSMTDLDGNNKAIRRNKHARQNITRLCREGRDEEGKGRRNY